MQKLKAARLAGFVGALGASAVLLGAAATTTGAYFTDAEDGSVSAKSGSLTLDKNNDYTLNFDNLVPGEYKSKEVGYHTGGDATEDIWLRFPDGVEYGMFTGAKNGSQYAGGGLGRYGHFEIKNNANQVLFSSYNLQNESDTTSGCADADGHGSNRPAVSETDTDMGYCGVPHYIKVESDVAPGTDAKLTMVFGLTGKARGQNTQVADHLPFQVVATQAGVRPDAKNF
jgi:hypothetical protein